MILTSVGGQAADATTTLQRARAPANKGTRTISAIRKKPWVSGLDQLMQRKGKASGMGTNMAFFVSTVLWKRK